MVAQMFILAIILQDNLSSSFVIHLTAPLYISKDDESFWVNCSASEIPNKNAAQFIIDGSGTRLSGTRDGCYSSSIEKYCSTTECLCSPESPSFLLNIKPMGSKNITITCSMHFVSMQFVSVVSRSHSVQILDISRPNISLTEVQPLLVGSKPRVRCHVSTTLDVRLKLDCFNTTSTGVSRNLGAVETDLSVVIKTPQKNNCSCSLKYMNFIRTVFREILTTDRPSLTIESNTNCNATKSITLLCEIRVPPSLHAFGFGRWTFKLDGVNVKHFTGINNGTQSSLTIDDCSYLHMGTYICSGFVGHNDTKYWSNNKTELAINSGPVIINTEWFIKDLHTVLSVKYFSQSFAASKWYKNDKLISNELNLYVDTLNTLIPVKIFEVNVNRFGYDSQLTIKSDDLRNGGQFHVVLQNDHGFVRHNFTISEVFTFPHLWTWFLISVVCVVILMTGVVGLVLNVKKQGHGIVGRHGGDNTRIYFAAPEDEKYRRVYNTTTEMTDNYIDPVADEDSNHYEEIPDPPDTYEEPSAIQRNSGEADVTNHQRSYREPTYEADVTNQHRPYEKPSAMQGHSQELVVEDQRRSYEEAKSIQSITNEVNMDNPQRTYEEPSAGKSNDEEFDMTDHQRTYWEPSAIQTNAEEADMTNAQRPYEEPSTMQTDNDDV